MESVVVSGIAALAGVLLGGILSRNGEYRKWLREERHKASVEFLAAGESIRKNASLHSLNLLREGVSPTALEFQEAWELRFAETERMFMALEAICLISPPSASVAAREYADELLKFQNSNLDKSAPKQPEGEIRRKRNAVTVAFSRAIASPNFGTRTFSWQSLRHMSGRTRDPDELTKKAE